MATELLCYRKGCGKKYKPNENKSDSCRYHPGAPVFHDAMKRWSCCKKSSTDFTEFLNTPGCTTGIHSNEKPAPEPKPDQGPLPEETIIRGPPPKQAAPSERPSTDEPMVELKKVVTQTLQQALEKQLAELALKSQEEGNTDATIGQACANNACSYRYEGPSSRDIVCTHHPGTAVFHEGMKFWSCCQKKTTEFDKFMSQEGCTTGSHKWEKKKQAECRLDWHQTGNKVTISLFAKCADPSKTVIKVNSVSVDIYVSFGADSVFTQNFELNGVINMEKSAVKMMPTKVEISLHKLDPITWAALKYQPPAASTTES